MKSETRSEHPRFIHESRRVGSRHATKVRVIAGHRWLGQIGTVVRVIDGPGTLMVRFNMNDRPIPFSECEVEIVRPSEHPHGQNIH
jgi:hypothetical protein